MPFQFYCPQGHLLEGHESQQGTTGNCPMCGSPFTFPTIGGAPPAVPPPPPGPAFGGGFGGPGFTLPGVGAPPKILNLLCPAGHTVPTPEDLLGSTTICPYCNKSVEVLRENTAEYRREQQRIAQDRDAATSRFWIKFSIIAGVLIVGAFVGAIVYLKR